MSGWLDGVAFIVLGSVFVSVVTGNFVILGVAVSEQNWELLGRVVVVVVTNAAGVVAGAVIVRARGIEAWRAGPRPVLAAELVVLTGAALAWTLAGEPAGGSAPVLAYLAPITFAMGMQAALVSHLDVPAVQVNYVSGLFTNMASLFAARLTHRAAPRIGVPRVGLRHHHRQLCRGGDGPRLPPHAGRRAAVDPGRTRRGRAARHLAHR